MMREIRQRYLGSLSGFAWVIVHPLAMTAIYGFVFVEILKARIPEADATGFLPYLAVAMWPWMAFAEALTRSTTVIEEHSELIGKVAVPLDVLVLSRVGSVAVMHLAGYAAVLLVLALIGTPIHLAGVPGVLINMCAMLLLATGLAYALSAIQVFVRDLSHAIAPVITLWFFATPILYSPSMIPEAYARLLSLNPMAWMVEEIRRHLLQGQWQPSATEGLLLAVALAMLFFGRALFRRLSPHFEDYL